MGTNCKFAHGPQELRSSGGQPGNFKTRMCKTFLSGETCPAGPGCHFAHGTKELRNMFKPVLGVMNGNSSHVDNTKTVLCKNWAEKRSCSYGDTCNFAHGVEQIRDPKEVKVNIERFFYYTDSKIFF